MNNSAVLVIDMQRELFDVASSPYNTDKIIQVINSVTKKARKSKVPVLFIHHERNQGVLEYKSEGWNLLPELYVVNGDYKVQKTTPDSFLNTKLESILKALNIDNLIICGYASEFCVDTTVRKAAALGYDVQLVCDAHTTCDKEHLSAKDIIAHHNNTLCNVSSFDALIKTVSSEDVIFNEKL